VSKKDKGEGTRKKRTRGGGEKANAFSKKKGAGGARGSLLNDTPQRGKNVRKNKQTKVGESGWKKEHRKGKWENWSWTQRRPGTKVHKRGKNHGEKGEERREKKKKTTISRKGIAHNRTKKMNQKDVVCQCTQSREIKKRDSPTKRTDSGGGKDWGHANKRGEKVMLGHPPQTGKNQSEDVIPFVRNGGYR